MSNVERIYFLGYSGHAYVAIEVAKANGWTILGYFDKAKCENNPFSIDYCGDENDFGFKDKIKDAVVFPAIGSNTIRKKIHKNIFNENIRQTVLIAPSASVSNSAMIGESTLVSSNAVINSFAKIGKCCIINTGAIIEHECVIGDFSHIAPGAVLTGNVKIGDNCFIGANATLKQGITIANNVTIGAGAVVLNDIVEEGIWVGNPAKLMVKK